MNRIFNYELQVTSRQMIQMPAGAQLLSVIVRGGIPAICAIVDESQEAVTRVIRTVSAGEEFNAEGLIYIDTFQVEDWFIGHAFEQPVKGVSDPVSDRYHDDHRELQKAASAGKGRNG